ncbi:undecaprenyldiphospho-muramoylpentapeptide beta-N-acetylglucosaminyltransferase [Pseudogracilibacillus sp. SO30301A]|uniref:undecaprenyldiphospho-muramoylpentapeptide beta-N-acetylglucosaminyltransferase n=1 Tax=Pseudogracilibacillus sp. SO30301A TaxID=3098291 RepID=UPI00300E1BC1
MKQKRILFTGGGTAGHVIVNLALIPYFQKEGWEVDYIGSKQGIERDLIKDLPNVTYYPISTGKLRRYMSLENFKDPFKVLKGMLDAWNVIRKTKPNVIFSKGGFVSVPVVVASRLRGVPTIIHESDFTPGLANKITTPFAKKVLTTFPETMIYLPKKKATHVGAVIREELFQGDKSLGYKVTNLIPGKPVILIMGGSIGSQKINEAIRANLDILLKKYQLIHICGRNNVDSTVKRKGYVQFEYVNEELKDIFAITDFVISRAGANAIFEFLALDLPMLLIPLSLAASRGDQIDNAKSFKEQGFAHVLEEEELSKERLLEEVEKLEEAAPVLKENMKKYSSKESREMVIQLIHEMAKK